MLDAVGIDPDVARYKRPHEFSGGQCQRISIARALVMEPELIICDEPVSALDVSVQAQILNLLEDLKAKYGLTLVFIAHDLAVVKNISDRVAVMYLGKMCELSESDELYANPAHPYTRLLMDSHPEPDPHAVIDEHIAAEGELPSPIAPPSGCRFRTRCDHATERCSTEEPQMRRINDQHFVACHHPLTVRRHRSPRSASTRRVSAVAPRTPFPYPPCRSSAPDPPQHSKAFGSSAPRGNIHHHEEATLAKVVRRPGRSEHDRCGVRR